MPFYGEGLDGLMRARAGSLRGIVNGIDYDEFNPETDKFIAQNYNAKNLPQGESEEQDSPPAAAGTAGGREEIHGGHRVPPDGPEGAGSDPGRDGRDVQRRYGSWWCWEPATRSTRTCSATTTGSTTIGFPPRSTTPMSCPTRSTRAATPS